MSDIRQMSVVMQRLVDLISNQQAVIALTVVLDFAPIPIKVTEIMRMVIK
jgi:hypothetical protein